MTTNADFGDEPRSRVEAMPDRELIGYLIYRFDAMMPSARSRDDYLNLANMIMVRLAERKRAA